MTDNTVLRPRHAGGRPRIWTDELVVKVGRGLLRWMKAKPTENWYMADYCEKIEIPAEYLSRWDAERRGGEEYHQAYRRAKEIQKSRLIKMGLQDRFASTMAIFVLKNVSTMRDQRHIDLDVPQLGPDAMAETMRVLAANGLSLPNQAIGAAVAGAIESGESDEDA